MKKKNYSYVGISFIILLFGIWAVPKVVDSLSKKEMAVIGTVPEFSFINQDNESINNASYKGKVYVPSSFLRRVQASVPL